MLRRNPSGDFPEIHEEAYVDATAIICGKVIVEKGVYIGPYVVIRADELNADGGMEPILIGAYSNIQDGVIIHSRAGALVKIGQNTSIAHRSIVHGPCIVGDHCFLGFNSVVYNCIIGDLCVIRHNAVVEGCRLPDGFHIPSTTTVHSDSDLNRIPRITEQEADFSEDVARANNDLVRRYKRIQNEF